MVARKCLFRATAVWFSSLGTPRLLISASLWLDLTLFSRFHSRLPAEMPIWECFLDYYARLPRCDAHLTCFAIIYARLLPDVMLGLTGHPGASRQALNARRILCCFGPPDWIPLCIDYHPFMNSPTKSSMYLIALVYLKCGFL